MLNAFGSHFLSSISCLRARDYETTTDKKSLEKVTVPTSIAGQMAVCPASSEHASATEFYIHLVRKETLQEKRKEYFTP